MKLTPGYFFGFCILLAGLQISTFGQFTSSPVADDEFINEIGVKLVPWVTIPDSPINGSAPRLNLLKESPDGSGRMFVIDQLGYLYAIQADGEVMLYLDIRDHFTGFLTPGGQSGFTSFAFHPEFSENGKFYTVTSATVASGTPDFLAKRPINPGHGSNREPGFHDLVLEWTAEDPAANTFSGSVRTLFRLEQPYGDHNIGELAFHPYAQPGDADYGLLFIPIADGGNNWPFRDADPENNGQDLTTALGSVFRIDPLGDNSANGQYGIPADNPFAGSDGPELGEIWTYGHRNPHRISWDSVGDHALYLFEIGQTFFEEINRLESGHNYGWGEREGTYALQDDDPYLLYPLPEDDADEGYTYPVAQYHHFETEAGPADNAAIAGGFVYRGSAIPQLYGKILTADFTGNSRMLYANTADFDDLAYGEAAAMHRVHVFDEDGEESTLSHIIRGGAGERTDVRMGQDFDGNLYLLNKHNGTIYRIEAPPGEPSFELEEDEGHVGAGGGVIEIEMNTSAGADWNVEPLDDWIRVLGSKNRTGAATVSVEAEPLPNALVERVGKVVLAGLEFTIVQELTGGPEDYFREAEADENDIMHVSWLGNIYTGGWPWIYIGKYGWLYVDDTSSTALALYGYDFILGWSHLNPEIYPWIYYFEGGAWIYRDPDSVEPSWFWFAEDEKWIRGEDIKL